MLHGMGRQNRFSDYNQFQNAVRAAAAEVVDSRKLWTVEGVTMQDYFFGA